MFSFAMVNDETNIVENVCVWDGQLTTWAPPAGYTMVRRPDDMEHVGIGWTYANGVFTEPVYVEPEQPQTEPTVQGAESL